MELTIPINIAKQLKEIPNFTTEEDERVFWAGQDSTEYIEWDETEEVMLSLLEPSIAMIEQIVNAALAQESLQLRSLIQQFLRTNPTFSELPLFNTNDPVKLALSAAIIEMLAEQANQEPPPWTATAPTLSEPIFLLKSVAKMKRLRQLCLEQSPPPLKKRGFYAPPNYLSFA